jgi:mediator of RNA polymerase II transcription subunit 5
LQIANRLEMSQKQHEIHDKSSAIGGEAAESTGLEVAALQLETVMDLPIINTRAGLFVFLNAMVSMDAIKYEQELMVPQLVARPLADGFTIINYLHSRYKVVSRCICSINQVLTLFRSILRTWLQL